MVCPFYWEDVTLQCEETTLSQTSIGLINWVALGACPVIGLPSAFSFFFRVGYLPQTSGKIAVNSRVLEHPVRPGKYSAIFTSPSANNC